jgi:hypothetical protein
MAQRDCRARRRLRFIQHRAQYLARLDYDGTARRTRRRSLTLPPRGVESPMRSAIDQVLSSAESLT